MLSIVEHKEDPEILLVRSREREPLEEHFPDYQVREFGYADYPFRVFVERSKVAETMALLALQIDYDNFKNSVIDAERHQDYFHVWQATHSLDPRFEVEIVE